MSKKPAMIQYPAIRVVKILVIPLLLVACTNQKNPAPTATALPPTATATATIASTATTEPTSIPLPSLSIRLGAGVDSRGITLDSSGDVDTESVSVGSPAQEARSSGNNVPLSSTDGNDIPDSYMQFNVDDAQIWSGNPTSRVTLEVDYFDMGTDSFSLEYDALPSSTSTGLFAGGGTVFKTNSMTFKTAVFNLCDVNFGNRNNGADFRISDNWDGPDIIQAVRVIGLPSSGPIEINVDDFGANPFDGQPDSDAIQAALDSTCSGDTIVFTSGVSIPTYKGYLIDKTVFLTGVSPKHDLTFTASDPANHALLQATADLKGFVVRLASRSRFQNLGEIDNIDFGYIDIDGNRAERTSEDNYGSWLPECSGPGDAWCQTGNLGMGGGFEENNQDYESNPSAWTTGVIVHDLLISNGESATALEFTGAAGTIQNVTINTAGDHVHATSCAYTDDDGDEGGWSDGMTLYGPAHTVINNTITNPSDVGIVSFGGRNTTISNNTIIITPGNYGAFAGIAIHPWIWEDISGLQMNGNIIISEGDSQCGGLHVGINLGPHMWGGLAGCSRSGDCQVWAISESGSTITMEGNTVTGAHINYLVEGLNATGQFIDQDNLSVAPQLSDWEAATQGCNGVTWSPLDKVAHNPVLPGYVDVQILCER